MRGLISRQPSTVSATSGVPRGKPRSCFIITQGARLIDSTPPPSSRSPSPDLIERAAWFTASRPDAQGRFTVAPEVPLGGRARGQPGPPAGQPSHVAVPLAGPVGAAEVAVVDLAGRQVGPFYGGLDGARGEV